MAETDPDALTTLEARAMEEALHAYLQRYMKEDVSRAHPFRAGFTAGVAAARLTAAQSVPRGTRGRVEPAIIAAEEGQAEAFLDVASSAEASQRLVKAGFTRAQIEALVSLVLWLQK